MSDDLEYGREKTLRHLDGVPEEDVRELIEEWRETYHRHSREEHLAHRCADDLEELVGESSE